MSTPHFYRDFITRLDAIRSGGDSPSEPAWRIYANTGLRACLEALTANFPGLARRMGSSRFAGMAAHYARAAPARDARLFLYGATLPAWLEAQAGERGDIVAATVDRCWTETHAEADAPLLETAWIARQSPGVFERLCLQPAPATRWVGDATAPVWDRWQGEHAEPPLQRAAGQAILLTRPGDSVLVQQLPLAGASLLQACEAGVALPAALACAAASDPGADLQALLGMLFGAGAFQQPGSSIACALSCSSRLFA
jgi:hypothetical protein